jgi:hypothetical protein
LGQSIDGLKRTAAQSANRPSGFGPHVYPLRVTGEDKPPGLARKRKKDWFKKVIQN